MKPFKFSQRGSSDEDVLGSLVSLVVIFAIIFMINKCSCAVYEGRDEDITVKLYSQTGEMVAEHKVDSISTYKEEIRYKIGNTETIYKGQYLVIRKPKAAKPKEVIESPQPIEKEKP